MQQTSEPSLFETHSTSLCRITQKQIPLISIQSKGLRLAHSDALAHFHSEQDLQGHLRVPGWKLPPLIWRLDP